MKIRKFLISLCFGFICIFGISNLSYSATNLPTADIGDYGNWLTTDNVDKYKEQLTQDLNKFQENYETKVNSSDFIPYEAKIGLMFMKALSSIDEILQMSLIRFTIIFLLIMYGFWVGLTAYKMIRESTDYKTVLYDIFKRGLTITIWVIILDYGPANIFSLLIEPILSLGVFFSDFILNAVSKTHNIDLPNTCEAIQEYVVNNASSKLLINPETSANIMCLPARLSVFFYRAVGLGFKWMLGGFAGNTAAIIIGGVSIVVFIKCIFKYAFMTLGIVADLFLTLLMLPFTALAESMPATTENNYAGQIFSGFLKVFNTKKLSAVISTFINAAIYFVTLAIIIAICASLMTLITFTGFSESFDIGHSMVTLLTGCLILHLANNAEQFAKDLGGDINNSFGKDLQNSTKTLWSDTKKFGAQVIKAIAKKK